MYVRPIVFFVNRVRMISHHGISNHQYDAHGIYLSWILPVSHPLDGSIALIPGVSYIAVSEFYTTQKYSCDVVQIMPGYIVKRYVSVRR